MSDGTRPSVSGYQLLRRVHRNTQARSEVWHATDAAGNNVALKLTTRDSDSEAQALRHARFNDEASAGQVVHEHVRRLETFGSVEAQSVNFPDGFDWLAFRWVNGESLAEHLARRRDKSDIGLSAHELRDITRALVNALAALHRASPAWIHRDVKPANVLLPGGDLRKALLADLGIAWREGGTRRTAEAGLAPSGTPLYMAPEQFSLDDMSPAVDQYALALTLWECATGIVPYSTSGDRSGIRLARTAQAPLPDLSVPHSGPAPSLRGVFVRALAADPSERFPDIVDFWHAFHSAGVSDALWDEDISFSKAVTTPSPAVTNEQSAPMEASRYETRGVWLEQAQHLAFFVGRDAEHARITSWIRSADTVGYLVLVGPLGQGKSALMSRLAASEGAGRGECQVPSGRFALLHMVKSHRDPTRILQSLLAQADRLLGLVPRDSEYHTDRDNLRELLLQRLFTLVKDGRAVTVFIDALDEIGSDGRRLEWLPPILPVGVKCVVSCRDDQDILAALAERFVPVTYEQLAPFSQADVSAYLALKFERREATLAEVVDVRELHERTGGTPLIIRDEVRRLEPKIDCQLMAAKRKRIVLTGVSRSTEAVFKKAYDEAVRSEVRANDGSRSATIHGNACERILQILACTYAPISARSLRALIKAESVDVPTAVVSTAIRSMRPYLIEQDELYSLWHRGFAEYIVTHVLGTDGAAQTHRRFIDWLSVGSAPEEYLLANYAEHLSAHCIAVHHEHGDVTEAIELWLRALINVDYTQRQIVNGGVYKHQRDLAALVALSKVGAHALSDTAKACAEVAVAWLRFFDEQAPILLEYPHLLAQQIANSPDDKIRAKSLKGVKASQMLLRLVGDIAPQYAISRLARRSVSCPRIDRLGLVHDRILWTGHAEEVNGWSLDNCERLNTSRSSYEAWLHPLGPIEIVCEDLVPTVRAFGMDAPWPAPDQEVIEGVATLNAFLLIARTRWESREERIIDQEEQAVSSSVFRLSPSVSMLRLFSTEGLICRAAVSVDERTMVVLVIGGWGSKLDQKHAVVFSMESGEEILRIDCHSSASWVGFDAHGHLLILDNAGVRVIDVKKLTREADRRLDIERWSEAVCVAHPKLRRLLMINELEARVFDLEALSEIRREYWHEVPSRLAILGGDHDLLVGPLGDSIYDDLARSEAVGVWRLPPAFWQPQEAGAADSLTAIALTKATVVCRTAKRSWKQCGKTLLIEFWNDEMHCVYSGHVIEYLRDAFSVGETRLAVISKGAVSLLDTESGQLIKQSVFAEAQIVGAHVKGDEIQVVVFNDGASSAAATSVAGGDDALVAEFLANGTRVVHLDAPEESRIETSSFTNDATYSSRPFALVRLHVEGLLPADMCVLDFTDVYPEEFTFSPGGAFLLAESTFEEFDVFRASNGDHVAEVYGRFIVWLDDSTSLWCHFDGDIFTLRDPTWQEEPSKLFLGHSGFAQIRSRFDVSRDRKRIVWHNDDAIIVSDLDLGV